MAASPIWINCIGERHRRFSGHVIERALRADLVKRQPGELRHLHAAEQAADRRHARQGRRVVGVESLGIPPHEGYPNTRPAYLLECSSTGQPPMSSLSG